MSGYDRKRARAVRTADRVVLSAPYSRVFVYKVKALIDPFDREYDPETRTWTVFEPYVDTALGLARTVFNVSVDDRRLRPSPARKITWAMAMFAVLPVEHHEAVYRALAKVLHPDRGGSTQAMQQLTIAYRERGSDERG